MKCSRDSTSRRNSAGRGGFVMVCVLWVLAILTVITLGFGHRAMLDRRASAYALDHAQAMLMARAAVRRGIVELRNRAFMEALLPQEMRGGTHYGQEWAKLKNLLEEGKYFDDAEALEGDEVVYFIEDMNARININMAHERGRRRYNRESETPASRTDRLFANIEPLGQDVLRRIRHRLEKGDFENEPPVAFQSLEELRFVRGVDDEDWFGKDGKAGLRDLLTTFSDRVINVNTASREVLKCIPNFDTGLIEFILGFRGYEGELGTSAYKGFKTMDEFFNFTHISGDTMESARQFCTTSSSTFRITGLATRRGGTVRAKCSAIVSVPGSGPEFIYEWREGAIGSQID